MRRPRWWMIVLRIVIAGLLVLAAVFLARVVSPASSLPGGLVVPALSSATGATLSGIYDRYRTAWRWEEMQRAALASDEQMDAAEAVVREGVAPADEQARTLAVRVARTQEQIARYGMNVICLAVGGAALLLTGALSSPWWLLAAPVCGAELARVVTARRHLRRRRHQLESLTLQPA
jgi:hypothetical protein